MDSVVSPDMLLDLRNLTRDVVTIASRPVFDVPDSVYAQPERTAVGMASALIGQTLTWLAEQFGTRTARLLQPLPTGGWLVTAHRRDGMLTYPADESEVAMAWMVALGRQPLTVTRPRVAQRDGSGVRPISAKTYVGLPVICQDELVGVIELAGDLPVDAEEILMQTQPRLSMLARRLVHDLELRADATDLSLTLRISLAGSIWCLGEVELNADEVRFLSAVQEHTLLDDVREATAFSADYTVEITRALLSRGLIALDPR